MFSRSTVFVWVGVILLSGMFLMGQEPWPPARTETIAFLTDGYYSGDLGGLDGADAICQAEADAAGLDGTFIAWLSDTSRGPANRFVRSGLTYELVDGTPIAYGWNDLVDGILAHELDVTATGVNPLGLQVWTNTRADGTPRNEIGIPSYDSCNDWTSSSADSYAAIGEPVYAFSWWTEKEGDPWRCDMLQNLYCFEM